MKIQEYFRTPRGYKRLGIWSAVVLLTIPVMRPITFLLHYVTESSAKILFSALWIGAGFLAIWLVLAILKWKNVHSYKRFTLFCAGTAVVLYMVYAFAFSICIRNKPVKQGSVAIQGVHGLYNPVGCRIAKWDKPYIYVSEFYNVHLRERCYVAIYSNEYSWVDATGLMEIDMFTKDWKPLDRCAVMIVEPKDAQMPLDTYLNENVGVEGITVYSKNNYNSWKAYQNDYKDYECNPIDNRGHQFRTYDYAPVYAFEEDYLDGEYYGWADRDFYDSRNRLVGRSFKHIGIVPLNKPAYMDTKVNE